MKAARGTRGSVIVLAALLLFSGLQCRLFSGVELAPPSAMEEERTLSTTVAEATAVTDTPRATVQAEETVTATPSASPTTAPAATATMTATAAPTETPLPHALYCTEPPEDYTRVAVGQHMLNARTLAMLHTAQAMYDGPGDIMRVTQGSYRDEVAASFGTHAGGGAVDISIRDPQNESVFLWDEAEAMVLALRYAGFAAWFRDVGDLGEGSAAHIHAIAVGDVELSEAAQGQVTGEGGYLAGMDGLIAPYGPNVDGHGGPVVCDWMKQVKE